MRGSHMGHPTIGRKKLEEIVSNSLREPSVTRTLDYEEPKDWMDLQEKTAKIFKELGCKTDVDIFVKGARTRHKIDVWAIFDFGGIEYKINIECKYWNTKVKKEQVSTLLGVLADIGAEKGIIVSKKGFQDGAHRLAAYTNIDLLTFPELIEKSQLNIERFKINSILYKIRELRRPLLRFQFAIREEARKKDLFWYPGGKGANFSTALTMLRTHIEYIDVITFPRNYMYSFVAPEDEEVHKVVKNRSEYLNAVLDNLTILEEEYEKYKKEIFSE